MTIYSFFLSLRASDSTKGFDGSEFPVLTCETPQPSAPRPSAPRPAFLIHGARSCFSFKSPGRVEGVRTAVTWHPGLRQPFTNRAGRAAWSCVTSLRPGSESGRLGHGSRPAAEQSRHCGSARPLSPPVADSTGPWKQNRGLSVENCPPDQPSRLC